MNKDRYNRKDVLSSLNSEFRDTIVYKLRNSILTKMNEHVRLEWMYVVSEMLNKADRGDIQESGNMIIDFPGPEKFNYTFKSNFSYEVILILRFMGFTAKLGTVRKDPSGDGCYRNVSVLIVSLFKP